MSQSLLRDSARPALAAPPRIQFRTPNGYSFWPVPLPDGTEEAESRHVGRLFEVLAPDGERRRCRVEVAGSVRALAEEIAGDELWPGHPAWDAVCRSGLSYHLWATAAFPPDPLIIHSLNREQMRTVSTLAGGR